MNESFESSSPDPKRLKSDLSPEDVAHPRANAHTQLTAVFLRHAAYFKENFLTQKDFSGLVDTLIPGEDILLLQLLCPVPAELNDGAMLSLTQGGASLQHLSPEARARVPTLAGYDELFKDIDMRIVIFNCRDVCSEDVTTGRCDKCFVNEAEALRAGFLVIGELAANLQAPIYYVSMAGTKSNVKSLIAPELKASGNFKVVFGNGYHLSLVAYPAIMCFGNSFLCQVRMVSYFRYFFYLTHVQTIAHLTCSRVAGRQRDVMCW